jgi:hypothetical protein
MAYNYLLYVFMGKLREKIKLLRNLIAAVVIKYDKSIYRIINTVKQPVDPMRRVYDSCA